MKLALMGNEHGTGNRDKEKTEEHKRKISESIKKRYEKKRKQGIEKLTNGGRPKKDASLLL